MLVASLTFDNFVTEIWIRNLCLQLNLSSSRHEQVWDAYLHQSTRGAPGELSFVIQSSVSATMEQVQLTGYQGTDVMDEFTAQIHFKDPFAPFLIYAGSPYLPMLSPTAT